MTNSTTKIIRPWPAEQPRPPVVRSSEEAQSARQSERSTPRAKART